MFFIIVPTFYVVFKVVDRDHLSRQLVKEFKSKGAAIKWIYKEGEKGVNYTIETYYRMNA